MTNWYHYFTWKTAAITFCRYLTIKYNAFYKFIDSEPEPPFFMFANHAHKHDPFLIGGHIQHPLNYMANVEAVSPFKAFWGHLIGVYGKKKGLPDYRAVKTTVSLIRANHAIGIFPEGDRSWDGRNTPVMPNAVDLLKKLRCPLRIVHLAGNYLSWPRWADFPRHGKIILTYRTIQADKIHEMSASELTNTINQILSQNDFSDPELNKIEYSGKNTAHGIARVLWLCPKCKNQDCLAGNLDIISCSVCGESWNIDANCRIAGGYGGFPNLQQWMDFQKNEAAEGIKTIPTGQHITKTKNISFSILDPRSDNQTEKGSLFLFSTHLEFRPLNNTSPVITVPLSEIKYYIDNFNHSFIFGNEKTRYKVFFYGQSALKFITMLDALKI